LIIYKVKESIVAANVVLRNSVTSWA
jgi:hypothetical protein